MTRERILIAVKTYPTLSETYIEVCCTAGFREDGSWIRIYPIPFRLIDKSIIYKKYQWIEADVIRNFSDQRPESYKIIKVNDITPLNKIDTGKDRKWGERKEIVFRNKNIHTNLKEIIELAHNNQISLAVFKPTRFLDFCYEPNDHAKHLLNLKKVEPNLHILNNQGNLFEGHTISEFNIMPYIPYKFFYKFEDDAGKESRLMIEDWEIAQLYLNSLREYKKQTIALEKVQKKYQDEFLNKKDLYLFLGTTLEWHRRKAKNPFVIIGVFYPNK